MASWSSGNAFASGAGGLKFKSRAGQMGHSVANGLPLLQHFFESSKLCCSGAMTWRWAPQTRYMLRRYKASVTKDLFDLNIRKRLILKKMLPLPAPFQNFCFPVRFRFQPLIKVLPLPQKINRFRRFHIPDLNP